jgi:FtsP/CotA-like multicopper oxidase with cupredoxin domain
MHPLSARFLQGGLHCVKLLIAASLLGLPLFAQDPADAVCPRAAAGTIAAAPAEYRSTSGVLEVELYLRNVIDQSGLMRYCYISDAGDESPTLRVNPGDQLIIHFYNELTTTSAAVAGMHMNAATDGSCTAGALTGTSSNLHFHGMNVSPGCQQDDVLNTLIQAGDSFDYILQIPANEPPGMYWYHPHPHGYSEGQTQGGATGAIIVEGIQNTFPALAGMPERTLILRDQPKTSAPVDTNYPTWDMSLNYVPVLYPTYTQAIIQTPPSEAEFWRLANQGADTIFQIQFLANGSAVPVQVYAIDGVPVTGAPLSQSSLLLAPGGRVEFVFNTPPLGQQLQMITQKWDTGPAGDSDPQRPIAQIVSSTATTAALTRLPNVPAAAATAGPQRFTALEDTTATVQRTLAFSENGEGDDGTAFYITVAGQVPLVFQAGQAPNIVLHAGTVEEWTIQNAAEEDHVFHIHQIHFQLIDVNGQPVNDPALRDTITVPHWSGSGSYPSVTLRMDFRDTNIIGSFPFHCHILEHEDGGMMGIIQVLPAGIGTTTSIASSTAFPGINAPVQITATVAPASTGSSPPGGMMQFVMNGGNSMWQVPVTNGQAVLSTTFSATGTYTLAGIYQGDVNYDASQSAPLSLTVSNANFMLSAASSIVIAAAGGSGETSIAVTPVGGFTGSVSFTCAVPAAMTGAGCSFAPATVPGAGKTVLTVTTQGGSSALSKRPGAPVALASSTLSLGLLGLLLARGRRSLIVRAGTFCFITFLLLAGGCGGGTHSSSISPGSAQTPAGSYSVAITATSGSGATQLTSDLQVQVQVQ